MPDSSVVLSSVVPSSVVPSSQLRQFRATIQDLANSALVLSIQEHAREDFCYFLERQEANVTPAICLMAARYLDTAIPEHYSPAKSILVTLFAYLMHTDVDFSEVRKLLLENAPSWKATTREFVLPYFEEQYVFAEAFSDHSQWKTDQKKATA